MDPNTFFQVKSAVSSRNFKDEKLEALHSSSSWAHGYFSADQIAELLREFPFDDDKLKALEICSQRMYSSTCSGVVPILYAFSFDEKKVRALEVIVSHITDRVPSAFDSVLHFNSDRSRARDILERSSAAGSYPGTCPPHQGHYHHHHHHHHPPHSAVPGCPPGPSYPGMPPPPRPCYPGMAPAPGPCYPGMAPPPGSCYPGMAPPPGPSYPTGVAPPPGPSYPTGVTPPPGPAGQYPVPPRTGYDPFSGSGIPTQMPYSSPGGPGYPPAGGFPSAPGHPFPPPY